jgi:hypothetical protein
LVNEVAYYDPTGWIDPSDSLIVAVEQKLQANKIAKSIPKARGKGFLPANELELSVVIGGSGEVIRLTEWMDGRGRFHLRLQDPDTKYRRGDFQETRFHHNPNGVDIPPPHHIHFPTTTYPLDGEHSYAHPVKPTRAKSGADYISALWLFCDYANIVLGGVSIPIIRRPSYEP